MASRSGRFIALAGIDGSGKATQAALLKDWLRAEGKAAEVIEFPRYGQGLFADMVAAYLRGEYGPAENIDPRLASLMYAGDRWQAKPILEQWLANGVVVVSNRYVCANQAHQGGKIRDRALRQAFYDWVRDLEYGVFGLPQPDLTILLHVPCELATSLVAAKEARAYLGGRGRDVHEADLVHQQNAAEAYLELAAREPNWVRVDCAAAGTLLPPATIAEQIRKIVLPVL